MPFRETLDYLYGLQRFGIKLGLTNTQHLLARLDHPERCCPVIHVAGTNGKGSVCAGLARVLGEAGLRVGLYTSPHLHCFTERIRINERCIDEAEVVRLTDELRTCAEDLPLTFFEFTTAMALQYFRSRQVDCMVLETGMGGRLDATNVVLPRVSVITPVSEDHAEHLGADLAAIAGEKAGIIKPRIPLVLGRQQPEALGVLKQRARELDAPVREAGVDFHPVHHPECFDFVGRNVQLEGLRPTLAGAHQRDNLAVVLAVAEQLREQGWDLPDHALRRGVESLTWPGRLERWPSNPPVLLDGAHNAAGAAALAAYLSGQGLANLPWVVGLSGTRRPEQIFLPWLPLMGMAYVAEPGVDKAVPAEAAAAYLRSQGRAVRVCTSPTAALAQALHDCPDAPLVVAAGSLYLIAEVRAWLRAHNEVSR
ncbi:bifunctional folylpolyglutamate synthase/dihydrofolate synthase [Geoalkalibacter halelectricus]|uniref:Bifunctional folylpolyglutamate synthase/dihydrofolate synthase n=1 Tax=Geoalkalibacter halelectricus TaxID=2847045 RepID=A0ABY5ZJV7_9BACT|nr:folylpolyglutamate synthase/dihydrofolate synthase family protein [Geoalkalibacter halelectricus]MDO3379115.1 bifunctional folylpolyglutamate synthase/dihydrofolate synthase [Geoalkalibacter halelectricus]UWZ79001.1 bifunctional folylpolyglutamate synthase/dihydrofolate synthase [Geoalkalibacter halelectricus]